MAETPRSLPMTELLLLGQAGKEPGFVDFLYDMRSMGFRLWNPEDNELSDDDWEEIAKARMNALLNAWRFHKERNDADLR